MSDILKQWREESEGVESVAATHSEQEGGAAILSRWRNEAGLKSTPHPTILKESGAPPQTQPQPASHQPSRRQAIQMDFLGGAPGPGSGLSDFQPTQTRRESDFFGGVQAVGAGLSQVPEQMAATGLAAYQGSDVDMQQDWMDKVIEDADAANRQIVERFGSDKEFLPGLQITVRDLAEFPKNLAYSVVNLLAGAAVGIPAGLATANPIVGFGAGAVASGTVAYRMSKNEFLRRVRDAANETHKVEYGTELPDDVWLKLRENVDSAATKYGLWEAVPEAASNVMGVGIIAKPLVKIFGKAVATRTLGKVAGLYGEEMVTETMTELGQHGAQKEVGLAEGELGVLEAAKNVAPQVALLTTTLGGAGLGIRAGVSGVRKIDRNKVMDLLKRAKGEPQTDEMQPAREQAIPDLQPDPMGAIPGPGTGVMAPEDIAGPPMTTDEPVQGVGASMPAPEEAGVPVVDEEAHQAATSPLNNLPEPTEGQKKAGNYQKGHARIQGLDISIENPTGSVRRGTGKDGKPWEIEMQHHYGYIKGTLGKDKDHIDIFMGPEAETTSKVFVVDQIDPETQKLDEHKVMLGFEDSQEARAAYLSNYEPGWQGLGGMAEMSLPDFKKWIGKGRRTKPVSEELQAKAKAPAGTILEGVNVKTSGAPYTKAGIGLVVSAQRKKNVQAEAVEFAPGKWGWVDKNNVQPETPEVQEPVQVAEIVPPETVQENVPEDVQAIPEAVSGEIAPGSVVSHVNMPEKQVRVESVEDNRIHGVDVQSGAKVEMDLGSAIVLKVAPGGGEVVKASAPEPEPVAEKSVSEPAKVQEPAGEELSPLTQSGSELQSVQKEPTDEGQQIADRPAPEDGPRRDSGREAGGLSGGPALQAGGREYGRKPSRAVSGQAVAILHTEGEDKARYEVREASDILPSHDAVYGFKKSDGYPDSVQERPYHRDAAEQQKVKGNSARLDPRFLVSDNPDAINGPPVVTEGGVVLGGNSRAMSIQHAFENNPEKAQAYVDAIKERAETFGIDPEALGEFERPVLVRVVGEALDAKTMARKARLYNQPFTQGLNQKAEGVSLARMVSQESLAIAADGLSAGEEGQTLAKYLGDPSSRRLIEALRRDGVIHDQNENRLLNPKTGLLTDEGKKLIGHTLRGVVVDDFDLLDSLPPSLLNKLDCSLPALARIKQRGEKWDFTPKLKQALGQLVKFQRAKEESGGIKTLEDYFFKDLTLFPDSVKSDADVQSLAMSFNSLTQTALAAEFDAYARDAGATKRSVGLLPGLEKGAATPEQAYKAMLGRMKIFAIQAKRGKSPTQVQAKQQPAQPPGDNIGLKLGEEIGGSRKDTAKPLGKRGEGVIEKEKIPTWRKRIVAMQVLKSGEYRLMDTKTNRYISRTTFPSLEEAEKSIPLAAVSLKHRVRQAKDGTWKIIRHVTDRKRKTIKEGFESEEAAMKYLAGNAVEVIEAKTSFGEEILPKPEKVFRTGAKRRDGDVVPDDFLKVFGFRGAEFGEWNNQEERQEVLDHSYDALMDLAEILNVPAKALSLNGELAIAFGARGHGIHGGKAHYENNYAVINLTKMSGAGSLAHEWLHALDHYLGRQDTKASSQKEKNERGDIVYPAKGAEGDFVSHGFSYKSEVREELRKAYENVIQTMRSKAEKYMEDTESAEKFAGRARDRVRQELNQVRDYISRELDYGRPKFRRVASEDELSTFDVLADKMVNGEDVKLETRENQSAQGKKSKSLGRALRGGFYGSYRDSNDTLDAINDILKAVRGRGSFNAERNGMLNRVAGAIKLFKGRERILEEAKSGEKKTKRIPTKYLMEAREIDEGRATNYWTSHHEMAARAFAAYVDDKAADAGYQTDFLTFGANNNMPVFRLMGIRPYPEGQEREALKESFDNLFATIKTKETDKGVALYMRTGRKGAKGVGGAHGRITKDSRRLQAAIEKDIGNPLPEGAFTEVDLLDSVSKGLAAVAGVFGKRVVSFETSPEVDSFFSGVVIPGDIGTIFVEAEAEKPHLVVLGHELTHTMRREHEDLYAVLARAVMEEASGLDKYKERYDSLRASQGEKTSTEEQALEELTADVVGDRMTDPAFWDAVARQEPGIFEKLAKVVKRFIDKVLLKLGLKHGSHEFIEDIARVNDAVDYAMAEYAKRQGGKWAASESRGEGGEPMYQRVFQGSPRKELEGGRLSTQFIGTGEGAAAYGWGLYFADRKEVAEWYRKNLAGRNPKATPFVTKKEMGSLRSGMKALTQEQDRVDAKDMIERYGLVEESTVTEDAERYSSQEVVDWVKNSMPSRFQGGNVFEVDIPEDSELLDWKKEYAAQPENVKKALKKIPEEVREYLADETDGLEIEDLNGRRIYQTLVNYTSESALPGQEDTSGDMQRDASEYLSSIGIPGHRYLDGTSRGKGRGTYNYVIYQDEAVGTPKPLYMRRPRSERAAADVAAGMQFTNPETEERFQQARKGLRAPGNVWAKIKESLRWVYLHATKHYPDLPNTKQFAEAREALRQLEAAPTNAKTQAVHALEQITEGLTPNEYELFTRKVILDDLKFEASREHALPFGFTPETLEEDSAAVDSKVDQSPALQEALHQRADVLDVVKEQLLEAGVMDEEQFKNPHYFRHQVLSYAMERTITQGGKKVKKPKPGYAKRRHGSMEDINASYIEAEFEYLHRALIDVKTSETIDRLAGQYDIKEDLKKKASDTNKKAFEELLEDDPELKARAEEAKGDGLAVWRLMQEALGDDLKTWKDFIPEGYALWQPDPGSIFYTGKSLPEKAMDHLIAVAETQGLPGVPQEDLQEVVAQIRNSTMLGGKKRELAMPEELVTTIEGFASAPTKGLMDQIFRKPLSAWKIWVLINPRRVIKYNLNNLSGDMDAVIAGNPSALKHLPRAIKELWQAMQGGELAPRYQEALERGVFDTGLTIQEVPDINRLDKLAKLHKRPTLANLPQRAVLNIWSALKGYTQFRENWLRHAAYLDYAERLEKGESMKSIGYGAAYKPLVDGLHDPKDRAALLARELVGDYGNISALGQEMRAKVIPFYSWIEINTGRYLRLFANAYSQGIGEGIKTMGITATLKGTKVTAYLALRMFLFYGLVQAWNNIVFGDEEDELDETERVRLHLNLGRDEDGKIRTMRFQGALSDFLQWVGGADTVGVALEVEKGRADWTDLLATIGKAPVNKVAGGITPLIRTPAELASGRSFWPDVFNSRTIRNKPREAFRLFSVENEYDWLFNRPTKGYWRSWESALVYKKDTGEIAYRTIQDRKHRWKNKVKGVTGASDYSSPRSLAMRDYKMSKRFEDKDAERAALRKLGELGVKPLDFIHSIRAAHPLYGLSKEDKIRFLTTLDQDEKKQVFRAIRWYNAVYWGNGDLPVRIK